MWTFQQSTGHLTHDGVTVAVGYSGHGAGVDNPKLEAVANVGPLPVGTYEIEPAVTHPKLGPLAMRLVELHGLFHGRDGFFIHGDNSLGNRTASEGCIIMPHDVRARIAASGDCALTVIA